MSNITKHVGKVGEKPCIIVFRELPSDPDHCVVVESAGLTAQQHDALMTVVTSVEAQQSNDLSEVLHRRSFPDGSNMLHLLHLTGKMTRRPVSMVYLTPRPNQYIPLADVNAEIRKIEGKYVPPKTDDVHLRAKDFNSQQEPTLTIETDPILNQARIDENRNSTIEPASTKDQAKALLAQAELIALDAEALMKDANAKREEAYRLDRSLAPNLVDAEKEAKSSARARNKSTRATK
jgi:hypothetical protein